MKIGEYFCNFDFIMTKALVYVSVLINERNNFSLPSSAQLRIELPRYPYIYCNTKVYV